jgi:hypothetical protein
MDSIGFYKKSDETFENFGKIFVLRDAYIVCRLRIFLATDCADFFTTKSAKIFDRITCLRRGSGTAGRIYFLSHRGHREHRGKWPRKDTKNSPRMDTNLHEVF